MDPCLFFPSDCILVVYVIDCILFSKEPTTLDNLIESTREDFILMVEGNVGSLLGIEIKCHPDGKLELLQPSLIKKIIANCGLQNGSHTHNTPATTTILQKDVNGAPRELP